MMYNQYNPNHNPTTGSALAAIVSLAEFKKKYTNCEVHIHHSNIVVIEYKSGMSPKVLVKKEYNPVSGCDTSYIIRMAIKTAEHKLENKDFWLIWSPQGGTPPRVKHYNKSEAESELHRLRNAHPNRQFYLLCNVKEK